MTDVAQPETSGGSIWRSGRFLRFWAGNAVSAFGDQVTVLALPFIAVTELDASPLQAGVLTAAIWAPNLLALLVGTWVDALRRQRRVLVLANLLQAAALVVVPVLFLTGHLTIMSLYAAAIALGTGSVLYDSAYPNFFVRLVRRDQYLPANSALSTTGGIASVAGPAAGGGLIQLIGAPFALLADAGSFLFSAAAIASVKTPDRSAAAQPRGEAYRTRLRLGVHYLRTHPILRASLLASATMNLASLAIQALLVLYATRQLHLDAGAIGLALGIGAVGGLVGALTAVPLAARIGSGPAIALGATLTTLPYIALPIAATADGNGFLALALAELLSSWAIVVFDINNNSLRAAVTADDMRARVAGAYSTLNYGIRPLGALLAGAAATALTPGAVIAAAALIGTAAVAWIIPSAIMRIGRVADLP